jgi:hypothetical protein
MPVTPPQKRNNAGIIVSVVLSIAVVAGLLIAGALALSQSLASRSNNPVGTSGITNGATSTAANNNIFSDPLTSNADGWESDQHCYFRSDGYHERTSSQAWACVAPTNVPDNFTAQVEVKQISGATNQRYGMDFRRGSNFEEYRFYVDSLGHWTILRCSSSACQTLSGWIASGGALQTGLNRENTLEVSANGSHFEFFANGKKIGQIIDPTYGSGSLALAVGGSNTEAVYTNLVINQIV